MLVDIEIAGTARRHQLGMTGGRSVEKPLDPFQTTRQLDHLDAFRLGAGVKIKTDLRVRPLAGLAAGVDGAGVHPREAKVSVRGKCTMCKGPGI